MRRPVLLSFVVPTAVVSALLGLPAAQAAQSPSAAASVLTVEGAPSSTLQPAGTAYVSTTVSPVVTASSASTGEQLQLTTTATGATANAIVTAAPNTDLAVGSYAIGTPAADTLGLTVTSTAPCADTSGAIDVTQVTRDGSNVLIGFAASYSMACQGTTDNVGEIRFASTVPYVRFGVVAGGTSAANQTVTVAAGDTPVTFGAAAISGAKPGVSTGFSIVSDTCSHLTVAAGATCQVVVGARANLIGDDLGFLTLPGTNAAGTDDRQVSLTIQGTETPNGSYAPVTPARVLDTRSGNGAAKAPLGANKEIALQVTGRGGVPATDVSAVVLNVTAISPTASGYLTAYPAGATRPTASSINFNAHWIGANLVTVRVGTGGKVMLYNHAGAINVAADVMGYYNGPSATRTTYGSFQNTQVQRLLDSRSVPDGKLGADEYYTIPVDYGTDINPHIRALAVNVTAVAPTASGFFTTFNGDPSTIGTTSAVNFTPGRTVPNMQIVPVGHDENGYPQIGVLNRYGSTHVVVDIVGFYDDNNLVTSTWVPTRFQAGTAPTRIVDSRNGQGMSTMSPGGEVKVVTVPASIAGYYTFNVVTNTTAVAPTVNTVFTLWPNFSATRPTVSNLNPYAGQLVSNMTLTALGNNNDFNIQNTSGTANAVIDVVGTMEAYPGIPAATGSTRSTQVQRNAPTLQARTERPDLASHPQVVLHQS